MAVVFQLKTIEAKKDIDVAFLIYDYQTFFDFLGITEDYKKITSITEFTDLVQNGNFNAFGITDFESLISNLNLTNTAGTTARKADFYINLLVDCLHYNYNIVLVNMSGTSTVRLNRLKAALNGNIVKFVVYDPLVSTITSTQIDVLLEAKIPVIFNSTTASGFIENKYITNRSLNINTTFAECSRISGLDSVNENFKPFVFCSTGVKRIQRYYNRDDVDNEFSALPYVLVSLVSDAAGALARSFVQYPWYSPAGFERGKILNQNFITADGASLSETIIPDTPSDLSGSSSSDLGIVYARGLNTFLKVANAASINEYFLLSDFSGITQSAIPAKTSISYGNLISYVSNGVKTILNTGLFEINDAGLRNTIRFRVESFLQPILANQGIDEYRVVCDESNNSQTDILDRKLNVDVYIKPSQTINFVELSFTT